MELIPLGELQVALKTLAMPMYLGSVALTWMSFDARIAGRFIPHGMYLIAVAMLPVVLPLYLIWTRGLKGVGLCVLHGVSLVLTGIIAYHLAGIVIYGTDVWVAHVSQVP